LNFCSNEALCVFLWLLLVSPPGERGCSATGRRAGVGQRQLRGAVGRGKASTTVFATPKPTSRAGAGIVTVIPLV